jgi:hypothetical protein
MAGKNSLAFMHQSQENFAKFMDEGTRLSAALEKTHPPIAAMLDELLEVALRIRALRQYCLNAPVSIGKASGKVDAERVIQILDGV